MKWGLLFLSDDFKKRPDRPDMACLPCECCAKCDHWINTENKDHFGGCALHSTLEWDAFSWADDLCGQFTPEEND